VAAQQFDMVWWVTLLRRVFGMVDWREYLGCDPAVAAGQLCAKGTRIPVTVILANLSEGLSREEIIRQYPTLRMIHVDAARAYAGEIAEG